MQKEEKGLFGVDFVIACREGVDVDAASSVTQVAAAGKGRTHDLISRHPLSSPFSTPGCVVRLIITRPDERNNLIISVVK